jgi:hypothetical protein
MIRLSIVLPVAGVKKKSPAGYARGKLRWVDRPVPFMLQRERIVLVCREECPN